MNKVLILATHPDDEVLGCGGTLFKHKSNNDEIHWLIVTDIKESEGFEKSLVDKREKEIDKVNKIFDFNSLSRLGLSTSKIDEYSMTILIKKISAIINKIKPQIIYLPFKGDIHSDHKKVFDAAYSCTKSFRYPFIKKVYMMETISETEFSLSTKDDIFIPNTFTNISEFMDKKIEAMEVYASEVGKHPFPRSERNIKALATFRGATAGYEYAESFMLLKELN